MTNLGFLIQAATESSEIVSSPSFWALYGTSIFTLLGTFLGAAVGAFTAWQTTKATLISTKRDSLLQLRREEYFNAIEIVHRMRRALRHMGGALSGREEPGVFTSPSARRAAIESDEQAAWAVDMLTEASSDLELEVDRLAAVGSPVVREQLEALSKGISDYMVKSFTRDDSRFIAKEFQDAMKQYESGTQRFLATIREDLKVDENLPA